MTGRKEGRSKEREKVGGQGGRREPEERALRRRARRDTIPKVVNWALLSLACHFPPLPPVATINWTLRHP